MTCMSMRACGGGGARRAFGQLVGEQGARANSLLGKVQWGGVRAGVAEQGRGWGHLPGGQAMQPADCWGQVGGGCSKV